MRIICSLSLVSGSGKSHHGMHAIARFSAESVRLSGVSATGNSFVRSVEFLVNRMVNETNERNEPVRFVCPKDSFIRTGLFANESTLVSNTQALCSPIYLSSLKNKMASTGDLLMVLCV